MNILPLNYNNSNNSPSFKQVYRLHFNKALFGPESNYPEMCKNIEIAMKRRLKELKKERFSEINAEKNDFLTKSTKKMTASINSFLKVLPETLKFLEYKELQNSTGYAPHWLTNHLKIKAPKPFRENYYTFSVYTNEEYVNLQKLFFNSAQKRFSREVQSVLQKNLANGKYKDYDSKYWKQILYAETFDKKVKEIEKNGTIERFVINRAEDLVPFYKRLKDAFDTPMNT